MTLVTPISIEDETGIVQLAGTATLEDGISNFPAFVGETDVTGLPQVPFKQNMPITDTGAIGMVQTSPPLVFAAGVVCTFQGWQVANIDTAQSGAYDLHVVIVVTNADGSSAIQLSGSAQANADAPGDSAIVAKTDLTADSTTGMDLSYNAANGEISSAGGGTYSVIVGYSGTRD